MYKQTVYAEVYSNSFDWQARNILNFLKKKNSKRFMREFFKYIIILTVKKKQGIWNKNLLKRQQHEEVIEL